MISNIIILIEFLIIVGLLVFILILNKKKNKYKDETYELKRNERKILDRCSMISYQIRNYKEGKNPYTVMSKILDYFRED